MKFSSRFEVPAAPDKVVALFFDPATMRQCLPGCEEFEQVDDTTYRGTLTNEISHVKFKAAFSAVITSMEEKGDDGAATVNAVLKGEDRRLGSTIKIDARVRVVPQGDASIVEYDFEIAMWGKLGRLGEAVIRRRSVEVERQFAENLAAVCAGRPVPHTGGKPAKNKAPAAAPSTVTAHGPQPTEASVAPLAPGISASRRQDVPFLVAVAAAAFAWGIIAGAWKRGR
ncbi:hypothetical protein XU06_29885 (plasmid) [Rhodococcus erythropolis]|uniref:CoxG family protein n=1 Tax=Rhodococcus erythropolis TaxID=1833 RepID=UPI00061B69D4|nr:SRPBCC domain-containing protein [Rhodococcus erythropolis]AKE01161.1 hypothetical protein XU06_29885 [Rhodococcus erythropolis]